MEKLQGKLKIIAATLLLITVPMLTFSYTSRAYNSDKKQEGAVNNGKISKGETSKQGQRGQGSSKSIDNLDGRDGGEVINPKLNLVNASSAINEEANNAGTRGNNTKENAVPSAEKKGEGGEVSTSNKEQNSKSKEGSTQEVPKGYANISLGMSIESVKEALKKNRDFGYNGERDVSLLPGENRTLIETDTKKSHVDSYLSRCYFQFTSDNLTTITLELNGEKVDYFAIFNSLIKKYGNPSSLNPSVALWKAGENSLILEKPLTLKYLDNQAVTSAISASSVDKTGTEKSQKMFLDEL